MSLNLLSNINNFWNSYNNVLIEICSVLCFLIFIILTIALATLVERKFMGSIHRRRGPNVVGIFGFLQPIADALKLIVKETLIPKDADFYIFLFAPMFTFFCSIKIWGALPFAEYDSVVFCLNGVLYLLVVLSLGAYGIMFAGWSSNSKYAFLGGLRSTAQMISYEVCLSFIFITIVILSQSLDFLDIVLIQRSNLLIFPLLPLWVVFVVCGLAETNRAPFDLPEAEAELVAGYNVEYVGIPFALFFLAEYSNIIAFGAVSSICFWGGWLPLVNFVFLPPVVWFSLKVTLHVCLFVWIRAAYPRYRYDQLMKLGWKVLLPLCLSILFLVAFLFLHVDKYCSLYY